MEDLLTIGFEIESCGDHECPECDGYGEVACPECDGHGYVVCTRCEGSGEITHRCPECDGEGQIWEICPNCDGTGYAGNDTCPECEGEGKLYDDCPECGGSGTVRDECPECEGRGEFTCLWCGGRETVPCEYCDGEGCTGPDVVDWEQKREHCGSEYTSPPYRLFSDLRDWVGDVREVLSLIEVDPHAYDPTGLHVHVGIRPIAQAVGVASLDLMRRIMQVWESVQDYVYDEVAFVTEARERYCQYMDHYDFAGIYRWLDKDYHHWSDFPVSRYQSLNLRAFEKYYTVEFRLWNGTDDFRDFVTAVGYSTGVVYFAAKTIHRRNVPNAGRVKQFLRWWVARLRSAIADADRIAA